jgi:low temperature requirement protein LtrA
MRLHISMVSRDPDEDHRASTPLELFFDLTFVVAVAQASSGLEQGLTGGRIGRVSLGYVLVFFGIWWAWMNFTWFASAYDTDDVPYRIAVLVQMTGVLILAAGVPRALARQDFAVMVLGYVVMRLAMVALWLRAAAADRQRRRCALRYAVGITTLQCAWIAWLAVPDPARLPVFALLAAGELCVPLWAEAASRTPWHPGHIAERYGLFTIIVLGEAVLATSIVVQAALGGTTSFGDLAPDVIGGLLVVFSMWWVYFDMPAGQLVREVRRAFDDRLSGAFTWGYGHYLIFASAAAVGAGLTVAVHQVAHRTQLDQLGAALTVTVPVAVYLTVVWGLHARYKPPSLIRTVAVPVGVALILLSSLTSQAVLLTGVVLVALVALNALVARPFAVPVAEGPAEGTEKGSATPSR